MKLVSSHRWRQPGYSLFSTTKEMVERYLSDAGTVAVMSQRLERELSPFRDVIRVMNGFEPNIFSDQKRRSGKFLAGWAGNRKEKSKGFDDILKPATKGIFNSLAAIGDWRHDKMSAFYNKIDVLCIASLAEGEPLTLLEGMASGCFIVSVDVGIVPELVTHRENGLIIRRKVEAFRAALEWCKVNVDFVREAGARNAIKAYNERRWPKVVQTWETLFETALQKL